MPYNLKSSSLLSLKDYDQQALFYIIDLSHKLKQAKKIGTEQQYLVGKKFVLIFEKQSTRTRCALEVSIFDQGGNLTYISAENSHIGAKETVKDSARVLGRFYDGIAYRGFSQKTVEDLKKYSGVPVFNALTDDFHPTQMLADLLTMKEHSIKPRIQDISYCYVGDARSNMGNSMLLLGSIAGMDVRIVAPKSLWPSKEHVEICKEYAKKYNSKVTLTEDLKEGVKGVDYIHTDVWVSMGESFENWGKRIKDLLPYQINKKTMELSGNKDVKFMHCLPAFHNTELDIVRKISESYPALKNGIEVTEDVFESEASVVFDQAENRLHTIKAVLVASLGNI